MMFDRELTDFLAEKCENIERPLNIKALGREHMEKYDTFKSITTVMNRVRKYRQIVYNEDLDKNLKIKLMFGLGAYVNDIKEELQQSALVEVDEDGRITRYEAYDGSLSLQGSHSKSSKTQLGWEKRRVTMNMRANEMHDDYLEEGEEEDPCSSTSFGNQAKRSKPNSFGMNDEIDYFDFNSLIHGPNQTGQEVIRHSFVNQQLANFLAKQCENVEAPLNLKQVGREHIEQIGTCKSITNLLTKIRKYRQIVYNEDIDKNLKIKIMFGLGAYVNEYLEELRQSALVEVDNEGRITKYVAYDGSLKLEGDHSKSSKNKLAWVKRRENETMRLNEVASAYFEEEEDEEDGSSSGNQSRRPMPDQSGLNDEIECFDFNSHGGNVKLEHLFNQFVESNLLPPNEVKPVVPVDSASQLKMLDSLHLMTLTLNLPSLSKFQERIEKTMAETRQETISMDTIQMAMDTCLFFIKRSSVVKSTEESISLIGLLYLIKQFVISLKVPGLDDVLKKISENINELAVVDKKIPADKVEYALTTALNILIP